MDLLPRDSDEVVEFDDLDARQICELWGLGSDGDILARGAFDRTLRAVLDLEEDGLYFRPGGWIVAVPSTLVRIACSAAVLAAGFQLAGLPDVDRELIIAIAALASGMGVERARLTSDDRRLLERLRRRGLTDRPLAPKAARAALARGQRREFSTAEIAEALDRLVRAGCADREDDDVYVVRPTGADAWLRLSLR